MLLKDRKLPFRFWIAVLVFFSTFTNYAMRVNMSVSVIAMSKKDKTQVKASVCEKERTEFTPIIPNLQSNISINPKDLEKTQTDEGMFKKQDYDQFIQGQILSGYGYGYIILSIPGGFCAEYFGPFRTIFWANFLSAILTALCVPAAFLHWTAVVVCRVLIGALGGLVYPALQILISRWSPPNEKGKFVSALMGNTLGTAITFPLVGIISEAINWAWGFFFIAIFVGIYLVVIYIFMSDSPDKSKFVSEEEREYLATQISPSKSKVVAPYKTIFTSVRFWALAAAHFANLYVLFILLLSVPKFFAGYLGFNLKSSGGLSAMPQIIRLFTGLMFGAVGDVLMRKELCSKTILRKSFILFSHILPGLCLLSMMFVGCNWQIATALLTLTQGLNGAAVVTNLQNPQDLAPNFAGSIFGIISVIGGVSQFIVPIITASLTKTGNTMDEWQWVFIIGGTIYILGGIIFVCFGTANRQTWNDPKAASDNLHAWDDPKVAETIINDTEEAKTT